MYDHCRWYKWMRFLRLRSFCHLQWPLQQRSPNACVSKSQLKIFEVPALYHIVFSTRISEWMFSFFSICHFLHTKKHSTITVINCKLFTHRMLNCLIFCLEHGIWQMTVCKHPGDTNFRLPPLVRTSWTEVEYCTCFRCQNAQL